MGQQAMFGRLPMKHGFAIAAIAALSIGTAEAAEPAAADSSVLSKTAKALEEQLACLNPPKPGLAIRGMLANGVIAPTKFIPDGVPVFAAASDIYVYGSRVTFVSGWEMEKDGKVKLPFRRGPGTAPPLFLQVVLEKPPQNYTPHAVKVNGIIERPFSSVAPTDEDYSHSGTTITCYG
jgi:hypothetical protein